jgi:3-isopropylmalate/(R)-2-methylmalate dehydratase small subunit
MTIDLPAQTIVTPGDEARFDIEPGRKRALMSGLDAIGISLEHRDAIAAFEARHFEQNPWMKP